MLRVGAGRYSVSGPLVLPVGTNRAGAGLTGFCQPSVAVRPRTLTLPATCSRLSSDSGAVPSRAMCDGWGFTPSTSSGIGGWGPDICSARPARWPEAWGDVPLAIVGSAVHRRMVRDRSHELTPDRASGTTAKRRRILQNVVEVGDGVPSERHRVGCRVASVSTALGRWLLRSIGRSGGASG